MKTLLVATVIMALGYSPLVAQNFEKGLEAYQAGDYAAAVQEWRPLAEQGNGIAQFKLGLMYRMGVGVQLNDTQAVKWYLLAAEQGNADAVYRNPQHAYTQALLSAVPIPDPIVERKRDRVVLKGDIPSPLNPPKGCVFNTRCPVAEDRCFSEVPLPQTFSVGRRIACHKVNP